MSDLFCRAKSRWREYNPFSRCLMELDVLMTGVVVIAVVSVIKRSRQLKNAPVGYRPHKRSITTSYAGAGR